MRLQSTLFSPVIFASFAEFGQNLRIFGGFLKNSLLFPLFFWTEPIWAFSVETLNDYA